MLVLMVVLFLLGYAAIAMEHQINVNKAASALVLCCLLWTIYIFISPDIVANTPEFLTFLSNEFPDEGFSNLAVFDYVTSVQIIEHVGDIAEILFFLMGAMTIVELIDVHGGFSIIIDKITVKNKRKLLWIIGLITFFMSAVLDNLTTAIVMTMMLRKMVTDVKDRWIYAGIIIIAANSGGAFSPIGDVTTIMLWVKGNISTSGVIPALIIPSLVSLIVPLLFASKKLTGELTSQSADTCSEKNVTQDYITKNERMIIFIMGISCLLFVPIFKTITHLPPFIGVLLGLSLMWIYTEIMYLKKRNMPQDYKATISVILSRIDMTTILFFLGILMAVSALQSAGLLAQMAQWLDVVFDKNIYIVNIIIGFLSSIVDNVPLVAGAMGMYELAEAGAYALDGNFWLFLAYCAGVGGSMLIIGSAAGVVVMGLEKISFGWYLKNISLLAMLGYLAGAAVFVLSSIYL
jgi:Na+/H+ antiporter NhaD/arsenite permease-like protein